MINYFKSVDPNANNDSLKKWSVYTPYKCFDIAQDLATGEIRIKSLVLDTDEKKSYVSDEQYGNGTLYIPEYYRGLPVSIIGIGNAALNTVEGERSLVKKVVIADNVKTIEAFAFKGFSELTEVAFGSGTAITDIGKEAFYGINITSLVIRGENDVNIGERAFAGTKLTTVTIAKVGDVGVQAFADIQVAGLTVVFDSARNIGVGAFSGVVYDEEGNVDTANSLDASALTSITVSSGLGTVAKGAFREIPTLTKVTLVFGQQSSSIGDYAFYDDSAITELKVSIEEGKISSIGNYAFYNTSGISSEATKNTFASSGVYAVGEYAFYQSAVRTVPDSLTTVGAHAYEGATGIGKVDLKNADTIGEAAFMNSWITSFTFGAALRSVAWDSGDKLGSFRNTPRLESIIDSTGGENEYYGVKNNLLYAKTDDGYVAIKYPEKADGEIGVIAITKVAYGAFRNTEIKTARFSTLVEIGACAFENCDYLTKISRTEAGGLMVGGSLTKIGTHAFNEADNLTKLSLNDLTSLEIGISAFENASALADVYVSANSIDIKKDAFKGIPAYATISLESPSITLANGLFSNAIIYIANYNATASATLKSKVESGNYVVFYTPSECLVVDKDGKFSGASNSCSLHSEGTHTTVYLPLYFSATRKITEIYADGGVLKDGDGGNLTGVYHYYLTGHVDSLSGDTVAGVTNEIELELGTAVGL